MRYLLILGWMLLAQSAYAQSGVASLICEARPTKSCVLDMAVEAALAVPAEPGVSAPLRRIVETAARMASGRRARAGGQDTKGWRLQRGSELVYALVRAGRTAELPAFLAGSGESVGYYAYGIATLLVELDREQEIPAIVALREAPLDSSMVARFHALGHARAGRMDRALRIINDVDDPEMRNGIAANVIDELHYRGRAQEARPLLSVFTGDEPHVLSSRARVAAALGDLEQAHAVLEKLPGLDEDHLNYLREHVLVALAKSGDWQGAVELAREAALARDALPSDKGSYFAQIAASSGRTEVFALLEQAIKVEPDEFHRQRLTRLMVSASIKTGFAPAAGEYIRGQEAMQLVKAIENPSRKAWAIWKVADELEE